jgi:hypothetical protein
MLVAALLTIFCFAAFLYLIDYAARLLRPISILALVCKYGLAVIRAYTQIPIAARKARRARASTLALRTGSFAIWKRRALFLRSISGNSWMRPRELTASLSSFPK